MQTVNCIEGCRTWVSGKTLAKLAEVLGVEVFQLVGPVGSSEKSETRDLVTEQRLQRLRQEIKDDIDERFALFDRKNSH